MVINYKKKLLLLTFIVFITSCDSNKNQDISVENPEDSVIEVSDTEEVTEQPVANSEESVSHASSKNSYTMPLENYIDFNDYDNKDFFTPLFIAKTTRELSDQDKLNLMSAEYFNEQDAFKKRDMEKSLLPTINKEISKYQSEFGLKFPIGEPPVTTITDLSDESKDKDPMVSENFNIGSYDFEKQEFSLAICTVGMRIGGNRIFQVFHDFSLENNQNISLKFAVTAPKEASYKSRELVDTGYSFTYEDLSCGLKVSDESLARKIEGLLQNDEIDHRGYIYYKIKANNNHLIAYPTYAEITYFNAKNGEELATQEFTWNPDDEYQPI